MLQKFKQRGQILVFYAFMIPTLIIFVGAVADFGWWYFNQSRLQNAADAAVLAGASEMIANNVSYYKSTTVRLIGEIPAGFNNDADLDSAADAVSKDYATTNFFKNYDMPVAENLGNFFTPHLYQYGDKKYYVVELRENVNHLFEIMKRFGNMPIHAVAIAEITSGNLVKVGNYLAAKNVVVGNWEVQDYYRKHQEDYKKQSKSDKYLFDGNWNHFQSNSTKTKSIVYSSGDIYRTETINIKATKNSSGGNDERGTSLPTNANNNKRYSWKELHSINIDFAQDVKFILKSGSSYITGDWDLGADLPGGASDFESINTTGGSYSADKNLRVHALINFDEAYPSEKVIEVRKIDKTGNFIGDEVELYYISDTPSNGFKITVTDQNGKNVTADFLSTRQYIKDILNATSYKLWAAAKILEVQDANGNFKEWHYVYDPLWTRIESEPMWSYLGNKINKSMVQLNSVRQLVLTFNASNVGNNGTDDNPEDADKYPIPISGARAKANGSISTLNENEVILRPIVVFYDGPETNSRNIFLSEDEKPADTGIRDSQPVILNLNADLNGIFYMPNSPVILNHNDHKFYGFIVAKEYRALKTEEDGDIEMRDGRYFDANTEVFKVEKTAGLVMFVDETGTVQTKPYTGEMSYGTYKTFNVSELDDVFFDNKKSVAEDSEYNLLTS